MKPSPALIILLLWACQPVSEPQETNKSAIVFAFGSCNRTDLPQVLWQDIINEAPDVWIWLGDNMYGDSDNVDTLVQRYSEVLATPGYQKLQSIAEIIGTWDDHDYGKNDGGVEYIGKEASQQAFLDFLKVPKNDPRRSRKGIYSSEIYEVADRKIKVILLDSRYHRDAVLRIEGVYQQNDTGTVLGEEQWLWLEKELTDTDADIHLIGNGIQYLSWEHRFEKWDNFPNERKRLMRLIASSQAKGVILLSGDRHVAEVSEVLPEGIRYPIRDVTASGLTHSYESAGNEQNRHRISPLIGQKNFGLLKISANGEQTEVVVSLKGLNDTTFYTAKWLY